jgi:hypothetical protein
LERLGGFFHSHLAGVRPVCERGRGEAPYCLNPTFLRAPARKPSLIAWPTKNLTIQASLFRPIGWTSSTIGSMPKAIKSIVRGAVCRSKAHTRFAAKLPQAKWICVTNTAIATTRGATVSNNGSTPGIVNPTARPRTSSRPGPVREAAAARS